MKISIKEAADLVGGKIFGNANVEITNVAKIEESQKGDLTFLYLPAYDKFLTATKASAILVKPDTTKDRNDLTYIEVKDPHAAMQKIIVKYFNTEIEFKGIDPTASVNSDVKLGKNVTLGKNAVISAGCIVGDNTIILHNTTIMENVVIGSNTLIYSNVAIRENCEIGNNVIIHSGTVIGSDGFGYAPDEKGIFHKIPQIGNVVVEDDVEIGSNVSVDRAAMGSTIIKKGVKIDNLVQIAHNVVLGENTVVIAQTGISGSTKIGNNCILAGQVGIVGHIEIGDGILISAQSGVSKSLTKPGKYRGSPAMEMGTSLRLESHIRNLPDYANTIRQLEEKIKTLQEEIQKIKGKDNF
ncbi:MAG: UDP-3-O-(3-hydroxymyristoyl)glucosamine N-acyltransferase [Ignavibacteria bacterium RBG_13_36_8]|nr:MAG: UDP-3-O-(3-hydroxymyristoyl)glucosamine N-acyltransferase [Ignavibacteria bacterium RBG_13_36_8]